MVMFIIAVLAAGFVLGTGGLLGLVLPRFVRWDRRTLTMLAIWGVTVVLAILTFMGIA